MSSGGCRLPVEGDVEVASVQPLFFQASRDSVLGDRAHEALASVVRDFLTSRRWQARFLGLSDMAFAGAAIGAGFLLSPAYGLGDPVLAGQPSVTGTMAVFALWYVVFAFVWGLYDADRLARPMACVVPTAMAALCAASATLGVQYLVYFAPTGRWIMALACMLVLCASVGMRVLLARLRRGVARRIVFVGEDAEASREAVSNIGRDMRDAQVVGCFCHAGRCDSPQCEGTTTLHQACSNNEIDMIVVQDHCSPELMKEVMRVVRNGLVVTGLVAYYEHKLGRVPCDMIGADWLLFANHHLHSPVARVLKRGADTLCAAIGLVLTLPLWPLVAMLIKATSAGPVFYRQDRVGRHGQVFSIIKFRTMYQDAENEGVPQWAKVKDGRVTPIGKLLRKTRFDEVPQFINVLKGEMSFVGPRPERPEWVKDFRESIPNYDIRHLVKPGITGWAQIMYRYAASELETKLKLSYDLYYVKNGTLLLDMEIVLRTLRAMMNGSR